MSGDAAKSTKKEVLKDIILGLHRGLSVSEAKERFEREVGNISSTEIAQLEQSLLNDGLSPDEIKKFCNVHALVFQSALEAAPSQDTSPYHPVYLFKLENREVEKRLGLLKDAVKKRDDNEFAAFKDDLKRQLLKLREFEKHYERKEQLLFPYLEKQGFMGPSKVMWGKDDEIRDMLKTALARLDALKPNECQTYVTKVLDPLIEEINGMVFKEENILFPTSLEKLGAGDWVEILRESDDIGYAFIEKPEETQVLVRNLETALREELVVQDDAVSLPTGSIRFNELMHLLNTLPVDMTFVDAEDRVRYFSNSKDRVFLRTKAIIGRKVQNCHPPDSVDVVENILAAFRDGTRDDFDFWINFQGKFVLIRYFAVRDNEGKYLGTLEVTQDITETRKLEGERRLLDERA